MAKAIRTPTPRRKPNCRFCECGDHAWTIGTKGAVGLVSPEDAAHITEHIWFTLGSGRYQYLVRKAWSDGVGSIAMLHREIMAAPADKVIDHASSNTLDNRRANLRACKQQENCWNKRRSRHNTTGFKGVSRRSRDSRFVAQLELRGRGIYLGSFATAEEAAEAYATAVAEHHKEFARTS